MNAITDGQLIALGSCPLSELFTAIDELSARSCFDKRVCKAVFNRLPALSGLCDEELLKLIGYLIDSNCTKPGFYETIFSELCGRFETMSLQHLIQLLVQCQALEQFEKIVPPNQVLVQFLRNVEQLLITHFQSFAASVSQLHAALHQNVLSEREVEAIFNILLPRGILKAKLLKRYPEHYKRAISKMLQKHRLNPEALATIAALFCRMLSEKLPVAKPNFYKDSGYRLLAAELQCGVNRLDFPQKCAIVDQYAKARIRDTSLLRTFARKLSQVSEEELARYLPLIMRNLESYANLNYPNQNIFEMVFRAVVTSNLKKGHPDAVEALYPVAIWGVNPGTISVRRVRELYLSIHPGVDPTLCKDHMRYELICRFFQALCPSSPLPALASTAPQTASQGVVSQIQKKIADFLKEKGETIESEVTLEGYPYPLDIVLPARMKVVEVDGFHHYDLSGKMRLGKELLKDFLLHNQGWKVIHVKVEKKKSIDLQALWETISQQ